MRKPHVTKKIYILPLGGTRGKKAETGLRQHVSHVFCLRISHRNKSNLLSFTREDHFKEYDGCWPDQTSLWSFVIGFCYRLIKTKIKNVKGPREGWWVNTVSPFYSFHVIRTEQCIVSNVKKEIPNNNRNLHNNNTAIDLRAVFFLASFHHDDENRFHKRFPCKKQLLQSKQETLKIAPTVSKALLRFFVMHKPFPVLSIIFINNVLYRATLAL